MLLRSSFGPENGVSHAILALNANEVDTVASQSALAHCVHYVLRDLRAERQAFGEGGSQVTGSHGSQVTGSLLPSLYTEGCVRHSYHPVVQKPEAAWRFLGACRERLPGLLLSSWRETEEASAHLLAALCPAGHRDRCAPLSHPHVRCSGLRSSANPFPAISQPTALGEHLPVT